jgi:hypothetical protein
MRASSIIVAVLLLSVISFALSSEVERCIRHCVKHKVDSRDHCKMSCEYKSKLPALEVFVDGVPVKCLDEDKSSADLLSDSSYQVGVNFDRTFYNTPNAFNDLIGVRQELMESLYQTASQHFVTPGKQYVAGTMTHILPVPIPLSEAQFNNQEFMNKLLDIVPQENREFKPASEIAMSDVYKDFLYNIRVDPSMLDGSPPNTQQQQHIKEMEGNMQIVLSQYMTNADACYVAYEQHLMSKKLSSISYTLESYTPQNQNCIVSDQKLAEYESLTKQLSDYISNLNVYNNLFSSIGKLKGSNRDWTYSKQEIQSFADYHRNLEAQGITPSSGQFDLPIYLSRKILNSDYFGWSSEHEFNGELRFRGLAWRESSVYPSSSWFSLDTVQKYKTNPMNNPKNYFGIHGRLNRIPTEILVAYKPELRIKISRTMKASFESRTQESQNRRPLESGPFVFTKVDITTRQGGNVNEEYEMVLSSSMSDPQIIGFKSHSIVQHPPFMQYVNKLVKIRSNAGTIMTWPFPLANLNFGFNFNFQLSDTVSSVDINRPVQTNEAGFQLYSNAFFLKNAGEGRVSIMSPQGTSVKIEQGHGGAPVSMPNELFASFSNQISDTEKFTLEEQGGRWALRNVKFGTYIRADPGGNNALYSAQGYIDDASLFWLDIQPDQNIYKYFDRMITLKSNHGQYLRSNPGEGAGVSVSWSVDPTTIWRMEYYGQRVALVSNFGTYLKVSGPNDFTIPVKSLVLSGSFDSAYSTFALEEVNGQYGIGATILEGRVINEEGGTYVARANQVYPVTYSTTFTISIIE